MRAKWVVVAPVQAACAVGTLAASLPASSWYRRQVSEGTKGPIVYEFARQCVTLCKGFPDESEKISHMFHIFAYRTSRIM
jgi:hypothetical protein